MLKLYSYAISLLEVPNEISLCFNMSCCPCKCKGCSEPYLQEEKGYVLNTYLIDDLLAKYTDHGITCICFLGGDNDHPALKQVLRYIKEKGLKTAFYSGFDYLDLDLIPFLDYYKYGRFILPLGEPETWHKKTCGPINFPWSNQKLYKIVENKLIDITEEFRKNPISDLKRYIIK